MQLTALAGNLVGQRVLLPELSLRLGSLRARLRTDDPEFASRFARIFHDCLDSGADTAVSDPEPLDLEIRSSVLSSPVVADISGHDGTCAARILGAFFPELGLVQAHCDTTEGWQLFARTSDPAHPLIAVLGNKLVLERELPWQRIVAHYFLAHAMRMQPDFAFFHAASVAIGNDGVFLSGDKGAGKSTLSLALAARGHGFLGDELGTIHAVTGMMLPFRRSVSIRLGPQAQTVAQYLGQNQVDRETLPDGTDRLRLPASQIFPAAVGRPVSLTCAFFLSERAARPQARQFEFSSRDLPLLAPLQATVDSMPLPVRTLRFLKLFAKVRCYILSPGGTPDETAGLIESIVEGKWDTASSKERSASVPFAG